MQLITVAEAASRLAVHKDTVRAMLDDGRLPAIRIGRAVRIEESELERMVARGRPRRQIPEPAEARPLTSGQQRALHAKAGDIDKRAKLERGTAKRQALAAATLYFGRPVTSARTMSEDEAGWVLDWLEEQQDLLL